MKVNIVSQDKKSIIPANEAFLSIRKSDNAYQIVAAGNNKDIILGIYDTEDACKQILNDIIEMMDEQQISQCQYAGMQLMRQITHDTEIFRMPKGEK